MEIVQSHSILPRTFKITQSSGSLADPFHNSHDLRLQGLHPLDPRRKGVWIPRLHIHGARSCELTHQSFTGRYAADDASGCDTLHDIFTTPSD